MQIVLFSGKRIHQFNSCLHTNPLLIFPETYKPWLVGINKDLLNFRFKLC